MILNCVSSYRNTSGGIPKVFENLTRCKCNVKFKRNEKQEKILNDLKLWQFSFSTGMSEFVVVKRYEFSKHEVVQKEKGETVEISQICYSNYGRSYRRQKVDNSDEFQGNFGIHTVLANCNIR